MTVIYKIVSPTGKVYIGSTCNFKRRMLEYSSLRASKQHKLLNSFKKHGFNAHKISIICECSNADRYEKENYFGILYNCIGDNGLNLKLPLKTDVYQPTDQSVKDKISFANSKRVIKQETKDKIRLARTGSKLSDAHKNKISIGGKGRVASKESIEKRAKTKSGRVYDYSQSSINGKNNKGKKRTAAQSLLMSEKRAGFIHKQETKNKISKGNSGKIRTLEMRAHLSNIKTGKPNLPGRIILLNTQTGIFYIGVQEAADSVSMSYDSFLSSIRRNKSNFIKTS